MKFYYGPGACSLGIHVLMEEIGKPYEGVAVNLRQGEQFQEGFTSMNPKSKVPTLVRDDGSVLTEFPAIAYWLARTYPSARLLPDDLEEQTRALETLDYVVATIHMQGASRLFRPSNFTPNPSDEEKVKARGREIFERGLANIDKALSGKDYVVNSYSIADAALFYAEHWAANPLKLPLPENCTRHYKTMMGRPAVQRTLKAEGLAT